MTPTRTRQHAPHDELVGDFRAFVQRATPPAATVAVVSKGDHELLVLGDRRGWHFPQRSDGVYAGYYPSESQSAIAHLESLRAKGAGYIAFPAASLWWLDEYEEFGQHLRSHYEEIARDQALGAVYSLDGGAPHRRPPVTNPPRFTVRRPTDGRDDPEVLEQLRNVFDPRFYAEQLDIEFATAEDALAHYVKTGSGTGADPHPLFDTAWYLASKPHLRWSGANPLCHFLKHAQVDELDPSPYFDTRHYYSQRPALRDEGQNALVHYVENALTKQAPHPNPLFNDSFYLATYRNVPLEASTPLEHFLRGGCDGGRFGSSIHRDIMAQAQRPASSLMRGRWRKGTVVLLTSGERRQGRPPVTELAAQLGERYHLGSLIVSYRALDQSAIPDGAGPAIVLEDFELAAQIFRPSALRLLARSFAALQPLFVVSDVTEALEPLAAAGVSTFYMLPDAKQLPRPSTVRRAFEHATRVLAPSSSALLAASAALAEPPANVSLVPFDEPTVAAPSELVSSAIGRYSETLVELASPEGGVEQAQSQRPARARTHAKPRIIVPCSDWNVSGVNASLEAIGGELISRGWDLEIVFTRREELVFEMVEGDHHLPALPHRFLDRDKTGVIGMWEALIAELERDAPSLLFMAYDFLANSVAPALSDRVGVVGWAQADDGDYHEQAYRLGLYCNSIVCVSDRIRDRIGALNPVIGERAVVIHNSSVWRRDVAGRRPPRGRKLRLAYSGRLVEYQKRVLDFIDLAEALDRAGISYELSLIGTFSPREGAEDVFRRRAARHLHDGRIKLRGRMTRAAILDELTSTDFFVLLSDFEGLPVSLVEAMARGCVPIVAESPSGIRELVDTGQNGMIVSGRDYDAWARLLGDLWRDRRRLSLMSRRARAKVRDRFTVEQMADRFADLFERIATEIESGAYTRPPALSWGERRSQTGDVLPPPSMHHPPAFNWV